MSPSPVPSYRKLLRGLVPTVLALLLVVPPADAASWRWTDAEGEVHYSRSRDSIPEAYRGEAILAEKPRSPAPAPAVAPPARPTPGVAAPAPPPKRPSAILPTSPAEAARRRIERARAEREAAAARAAATGPAPPASTSQAGGIALDRNGNNRQWWVVKIQETRAEMKALEREIEALRTQRRKEPLIRKERARRLRLKEAKEELAAAQAYLDGGIQEEARAAGAPPDWVEVD